MTLRKFLVTTVFALICSHPAAYADPALGSDASGPENDRWFFYISTGLGNPSYDSGIQARINDQKSRGGSSPYAGSFDLPGVYRRVDGGWAVGAVLNMMFENAAIGNWRNEDSFSVQLLNPSLSALYFVKSRIGEGWFGRMDLGMSRILQVRQQHSDIARLNDTGVIGQLALGYGWRGGDVCHVLTHLNGFYSQASERHVSGLMLHLGFLL